MSWKVQNPLLLDDFLPPYLKDSTASTEPSLEQQTASAQAFSERLRTAKAK